MKKAEFGYRSEIDNGGIIGTASKVDGRGTAVGTSCNGDGAELERDAQNAAQSVSAADAVGCKPENAPNERGCTGRFDRDANECGRIRKTGWESEREVFFRLQRADRVYTERCDFNFGEQQPGDFYGGTGIEEENPPLHVDLDYSGDLVRGAVRLGRAVEQMTDDAPTRDGTTIALHIDSKRRKKLRQKKTALGHAEDDHEDWDMKQEL